MIALIIIASSALAAAAAVGGAAGLALYPFLPADLGGAPNLDRRARRVRVPLRGTGAREEWIDLWHLAGTRPAAVLVLHGFGRTHHRAWRYAAFLNALGLHVVTIDFRSSRWVGRKPTTLGHFEIDDARAALDWMRQDPALAGVKLGIFGESLGGAVALLAAGASPDIAAVVTDCAFSSGDLALEDSCERWARVPRQPSAAILRSLGRLATGFDPGAADVAAATVGLANRPAFFIHSEKDDRLSIEHALRLWRAAGSKDPLWIVPGVGHNEAWGAHRALYEGRVSAFFARHLLGEGDGVPAGKL